MHVLEVFYTSPLNFYIRNSFREKTMSIFERTALEAMINFGMERLNVS